MKRTFKIIGICVISIVVCYIVYIGVEVFRFNNNTITLPLISVGESSIAAEAGSNHLKEKYPGLGYTFEYECVVEQDEGSDDQLLKIISGEMKLFDKFLLCAWIS